MSISNAYFITKIPQIIPGLVLWMDANDPSTITESSGLVSQWRDKSGRGFVASQGTGANQPLYTTNPSNSKPALLFDGVSDRMSIPHSTVLNPQTSTFCIFLVVSLLQASGGSLYCFGKGADLFVQGYSLTPRVFRVRAFSENSESGFVYPASLPNSSALIVQVNINGSAASPGVNYYRNGALVSTGVSYTNSIDSSTELFFGCRAAFADFCNCYIQELIMFNNVPSVDDQLTLNRYLANKWGISI